MSRIFISVTAAVTLIIDAASKAWAQTILDAASALS